MNRHGIGGRTFGNVFVMGVEAAAEKISARVRSSGDVYHCWLREDGRIVVRQRSDKRKPNTTDECLVGTYNKSTRIEWIENDLVARLQELSRKRAWPRPNAKTPPLNRCCKTSQ